jgi:CRISPR/Cas system-associated exonuclease Cas4 (RecB family)
MKVIPIKPITAWSYSRYSTYKQCPLKLKLSAIDKIQEPKNAAMTRGAQIHDLAEAYIKGKVAKLAPELAQFKAEFSALRKQYKKSINGMVVEDNWSFTKDWTETSWNDWVNCWVRIKLDCAHHLDEDTLIVTDWKTGKFRPDMNDDYMEQLDLYALAALLLHPHLKKVLPRLAYTDQGIFYPEPGKELVYTPADIPRLKKLWEKRVKAMMNDKIFAPKPNRFCNWCHYRKSNAANGGGQCKF